MWILEKSRPMPSNSAEMWTYFSDKFDYNRDKSAAIQFPSEGDANLYNMKHLDGQWTAVRNYDNKS